MSKAIYLGGSSGTARKVKNLYIGVDGVARKVTKGYIGDDSSVARLFYVNSYLFTIVQSANQTITVVCNGTSYTSSFIAPAGAAWTASVTADDGYTAGTLSATSGTVTSDTSVSASEATVAIMPTVTINQATGTTITVTNNETTVISGSQVANGSDLNIELTADLSTCKDAYLEITDSSGTLVNAIYEIEIIQNNNETITVICDGISHTESFFAVKGDTWIATITANNNYTAGELSATSGTVAGNTSISATKATLNDKASTIYLAVYDRSQITEINDDNLF